MSATVAYLKGMMMQFTLFRTAAISAVAISSIIGATVTAVPAGASPSDDPLAVVQSQGLLGARQPKGPDGTRVTVESAEPVPIKPLTPALAELDATTQAEVFRGPSFGTVTGIGNDGTNASFVVIKDQTAPSVYQFNVGSPSQTLRAVDDEHVQVLDENGDVINFLQVPWARDASGKSLRTWYSVDSPHVVTQHIETAGAAFPITADPTAGCNLGAYKIYFNRAETKGIAAGGGAAITAITGGCTLAGGPAVGAACAVISGSMIATAQIANANGNCLGMNLTTYLGVPSPSPFIQKKGTAQCK